MKTLRALLAVAGLSFAVVACAEPVTPTPAPAWKLKDVNGQVVSSEQFKGKVMVVDFWATWCGPCRVEIPGYIELQKKYGDELVIVGISVDAPPSGATRVKDFIAKNKVNYPVVMATDEVVEAFGGAEGISAIPTTFIVDREGMIRDRKVGAEHAEAFEKRLLPYLKKTAAE